MKINQNKNQLPLRKLRITGSSEPIGNSESEAELIGVDPEKVLHEVALKKCDIEINCDPLLE